jgi:DNA-binding beta-propeller fold protein YncE
MRPLALCLAAIVAGALSIPALSAEPGAPLRLISSVDLPGIEGAFDHFGVDPKGGRLFLAAEEHHTVEVYDLQTGKAVHSITGFDSPHSIVYIPDSNRLFIVDGGNGGSCEVLDGTTYQHIKSIKLADDADALVYDAPEHLLYVGNGGKEAHTPFSFISVIDTSKSEKVADIKVPSDNIESMAVQHSGPLLYVNMRDKSQVGVVDRKNHQFQTAWKLGKVAHNTPMALDEAHHRLFIAGRTPGVFAVLDTDTGKEVATLPAAEGVDDLAFDPKSKRIYLAGGEGFVSVYRQIDADHYESVGKVSTGNRGKIGVLVPDLQRYYVATSNKGATPARILIFQTQE